VSAPWAARPGAIGTFVKIPAPEVVELLSVAGLDFIVIDAEHGAFDVRAISTMVAVARGHGLQVFVRTAGHAPRDVQPALDAGADGLFIPHVDSPQRAQAVVQSCRFPPLGRRGGSPFSRPGDWGQLAMADYVARGNHDVTIVAQIESSEAAAVADRIGAVTGIDAVFVGPFDLALASGLPPGGSEVRDLIRGAEQRSAAAGVPVGGLAGAAESAAALVERGLDFVLVSNDASLLSRAAHGLAEQIRSHVPDRPGEQPSQDAGGAWPTMPGDSSRASRELREELAQLVTGLWYEIDHRDGAGASAYFSADAELRFENATFRGTAAIDDVYAARAARGPRVSRHVVTSLHVTEAGEGRARATSTLILYAEDGTPPRPTTTPALVADVHDTFEHHDGRWLILSRHIQHLFIAPATVLAVPTA
jgi:2-keto-3-deoxy-L-rhamnonate aldolase RhmA